MSSTLPTDDMTRWSGLCYAESRGVIEGKRELAKWKFVDGEQSDANGLLRPLLVPFAGSTSSKIHVPSAQVSIAFLPLKPDNVYYNRSTAFVVKHNLHDFYGHTHGEMYQDISRFIALIEDQHDTANEQRSDRQSRLFSAVDQVMDSEYERRYESRSNGDRGEGFNPHAATSKCLETSPEGDTQHAMVISRVVQTMQSQTDSDFDIKHDQWWKARHHTKTTEWRDALDTVAQSEEGRKLVERLDLRVLPLNDAVDAVSYEYPETMPITQTTRSEKDTLKSW